MTRTHHYAAVLALHLAAATAYTFTLAAAPTQCGNFTASWNGGTAPYELLLVPVGHVTPEIRAIVDDNIASGNSTSFVLKFPQGSRFIAVLSDATGPGSGGTSDILTVGAGPNANCLTSPVEPKFFFFVPTATSQCTPLAISWDTSASAPVSLWGIIPGGDTFSLNPPTSGTSLNWLPDVASGTQMLVVAGDSSGRGSGGSTDIFTVADGTGGCVTANSPSTTPGPAAGQVLAEASSSSSGTSTSSATSSSSAQQSSTSTPLTPLAGSGSTSANSSGVTTVSAQSGSNGTSPTKKLVAILVGTLGVLILIFLALFFLWRSRRGNRLQRSRTPSFHDMRYSGGLLGSRAPSIASADANSFLTRAPHENVPRAYAATPFVMRTIPSTSGYTADVSDASSSGHDDTAAMRRHLLSISPATSPTNESFPADAFKSPYAPVTARGDALGARPPPPPPPAHTPSPAPPSFMTAATQGSLALGSTVSGRRRAFMPLLDGNMNASTGSVDTPPTYDSWNPRPGPLVAVNADAKVPSPTGSPPPMPL